MSIIAFVGGIGTGKTLAMVYYAWQDHQAGRKIISNLNLKKIKPKIIDKEFLDHIPSDLQNTSILFDEIHNYIDSRNAGSKKNKAVSYFILQSRHSGKGSLNIYYTTQTLDQVDKRLRRNTDIVIMPEIVKWEKDKPKFMKLSISFLYKMEWKTITKFVYVGDILPIYDTHEIIEF